MQLIHQYAGFNYGKREEILNDLTLTEKTYEIIINLYLLLNIIIILYIYIQI